ARADTKIIPGHGPLANVDELRTYGQMLATVRARVKRLIAEGMSKDEVIAAKPTQQFDEKWGGGFMNPDRWVGILYESLKD
ncbi:MAG: MBL fold metallo-hydrolase, partial [Acidimicrobiia bacterium]